MSQNISTIVRSNVLTNSAAEFIETRAQEALGAEVVSPSSPQYVPVRDQFMPKGEIPSVEYHAESAAKLVQLETTLQKFATTIKERGLDRKLKIALKDPKDYSMSDVLSIARKIQEKHRDADKVKSAMGHIRKCFRFAEDHHGQLSRLLKFVPNDSYGTVISGGFTMILGAVERADNLRTDIYETLANIPLRLREVKDLAEVHYQSAELQRRADSVFVAILFILERIVDELSKNIAKRGLSLVFKGDKHGFDLTEAFLELEKQLKEFRIQAKICLQHRFGRMDYKLTRTMMAAESCEELAAGTGADVADIKGRLEKFEERLEAGLEAQKLQQSSFNHKLFESRSIAEREKARHERLQTNVFNRLYAFLTGNPMFDSQSGQYLMQAITLQRQIAFGTNQRDVTASFKKKNKKTVAKWLSHLHPAHYTTREDLEECVQNFGTFSLAEKHQVQWIITSDQIHIWLETPESVILVVESQTYPDGVYNPLSFTSSFLAKALKKQDCLTVCCFAGLRANESMQEDVSGPAAMLASLFLQLMITVRKKLEEVDIPGFPESQEEIPTTDSDNEASAALSIQSAKRSKKSKTPSRRKNYEGQSTSRNFTDLKMAIGRLLDELPDRSCVFILLDSVVHLTGIEKENDEAMRFVLGLAEDPRLVIKILVTGVFSATLLEDIEHELLFLPDFADAGSQDINPVFFEGDTLDSIASLRD